MVCCKNYWLLLFVILTPALGGSSGDVLYDIYPFIKVYRDGRVERFIGKARVPASTDLKTGVISKDVKISSNPSVAVRMFLPRNVDPGRKIPVLVYFHGGGFFTESAFSPTYHNHLNSLVGKANVVAVSVDYRLAPEYPLPIAYQDSWLALKWVFSHYAGQGNESWLTKYADFRRVYLGGDSAGGNIAQNMAIRIGLESPQPGIKIKGMFLNCPYFWGKKLIGNESANPYEQKVMESLWLKAYPNSAGLDDPLVNPGTDPNLKTLGTDRVLVYVAGKDGLKFRGRYYMEVLKKSGWPGIVKVVEVEGEGHVFNLINPNTVKAMEMLRNLAYFINH